MNMMIKIGLTTFMFTLSMVCMCSCDGRKEVENKSNEVVLKAVELTIEEITDATTEEITETATEESTKIATKMTTEEATGAVTKVATEEVTEAVIERTETVTEVANDIATEYNVAATWKPETVVDNGFYCIYTVKAGDTWDSLQRDYWVTKQQICAFNGMNPELYLIAGEMIYIPVDTYQPPNTWEYTHVPVYDSTYSQSSYTVTDTWSSNYSEEYYGESDGLVHSYTVTLCTENSEWASWYNINLSASMLNGFVLKPGQSFSWFTDVGACQYDQGFIDAGAYTDSGTAPGGGICFTSTALMQAARGADCVITEWHDHIFPVTYASRGDEAAISWEWLDLKFYNPSATDSIIFYLCTDEWSRTITVSAVIS